MLTCLEGATLLPVFGSRSSWILVIAVPQCGQELERSEIFLLHTGQNIKAICSLHATGGDDLYFILLNREKNAIQNCKNRIFFAESCLFSRACTGVNIKKRPTLLRGALGYYRLTSEVSSPTRCVLPCGLPRASSCIKHFKRLP